MENYSSSHDYGCSTSQQIPRILENLRSDHIYKSPHLISFKHSLLNYPPKSPKWFFLFRFSKEIFYSHLLYYTHATRHIRII